MTKGLTTLYAESLLAIHSYLLRNWLKVDQQKLSLLDGKKKHLRAMTAHTAQTSSMLSSSLFDIKESISTACNPLSYLQSGLRENSDGFRNKQNQFKKEKKKETTKLIKALCH